MSGKYPHRFEFDTLNSKSTSRSNIQQMVILVDYWHSDHWKHLCFSWSFQNLKQLTPPARPFPCNLSKRRKISMLTIDYIAHRILYFPKTSLIWKRIYLGGNQQWTLIRLLPYLLSLMRLKRSQFNLKRQ